MKYNVTFQASKDGYFRDIETHAGETNYLSFNEGIVSVSGIEDQPSTVANDTVLAQQFGISVSNNGVNFGNPKYVTVYNSKCQEINYSSNDAIVVILKVTFVKKIILKIIVIVALKVSFIVLGDRNSIYKQF